MKKLNLTILLTVLMSMVGAKASAHDIEVNNADGVTIYYIWTNNNTELAVSYRGTSLSQYSNEYSGNVIIPESVIYNGKTYSVTSISYYAFSGCSGLTSITIPSSVTSIDSEAFRGCHSLTSITIPNSVTSIGDLAFYECSGLTSITIGNCVTSIGENSFAYCSSLTSITIPNSVTTIGNGTFASCIGLASIEIPSSVTSIGNDAFQNCSGLTSITIPSSVTSIGSDAFQNCSGLTSVHISDIVAWCKIVFYNHLSTPLYYARRLYLEEQEIKDLVIPNSVPAIGDFAFACCDLTSVTIGSGVTSIGYQAFLCCSSLTSVTIGNSVTSIKYAAFEGCRNLTSVIIPNSVTSIGDGAFFGCISLDSITIPNSVTSIGVEAFAYCTGLTSVTIPNSVTSIGVCAFYKCSGLTSVTIGSGVTSIGQQAFAYCPELSDVYCYAENVPSTNTDAFEGSYIEHATLHVPNASVESYSSTAPWRSFGTKVCLSGSGPVIPETPKCATPTISYENGKLVFSCETEDVEFVSEVVPNNTMKYHGNEMPLTHSFTVSVYATKEGYGDSDVATMDIEMSIGSKGDVNGDGVVDVSDYIGVANIILYGTIDGK